MRANDGGDACSLPASARSRLGPEWNFASGEGVQISRCRRLSDETLARSRGRSTVAAPYENSQPLERVFAIRVRVDPPAGSGFLPVEISDSTEYACGTPTTKVVRVTLSPQQLGARDVGPERAGSDKESRGDGG